MKRWVWFGVIFLLVMGGLVSYVLLQLTILQPPVSEISFPEKLLSRKYVETASIAPIGALPIIKVGQAALYHKSAPGQRPVLMLPDLGGGAWVFEKFLSSFQGLDAYALSYRGGLGAQPASEAKLEAYINDAKAALARLRELPQKPVLIGQGMGALIALKIAQDMPEALGGLVLIAPYAPREWSDQQLWLVRTIGNWAYDAAYRGGEPARAFWAANFPSGFVQNRLAQQSMQYALTRDPFEYKGVIQDLNFTKLDWLDAAYTSLERAKFNVLQVIARYDTVNPIGAQRRLRTRLEASLGSRYRVMILNSGKYVSLDWRWQKAAQSIQAFARNGSLPANVVENEEVLDPLTSDKPDKP